MSLRSSDIEASTSDRSCREPSGAVAALGSIATISTPGNENDSATVPVLPVFPEPVDQRWLRGASQYDDLARRLIPDLRRHAPADQPVRLRIWCAAAASGEDAYSAAMTVHAATSGGAGWDLRIVATDATAQVIARAKEGRFPDSSLVNLSSTQRDAALTLFRNGPERLWQVRPHLRRLVTFVRLDLARLWPAGGPFDAIICRNVVRTWAGPARAQLLAELLAQLTPGGTLYLGHEETLDDELLARHGLRRLSPSNYVRDRSTARNAA